MKGKSLIIVGILSLAIGFFTGQAVNADAPAPGSEGDPLVSKSFMDVSLQSRVTEMQGTIDGLNNKIKELSEQVNTLSAKLNLIPKTSDNNSNNNNQNNTGNNNTPAQPPKEVVKQYAYVLESNSYSSVNVRSGPGTTYDIVDKAQKNEPMEILKKEQDKEGKLWYQVKLQNGKTAWVASWVVEVR